MENDKSPSYAYELGYDGDVDDEQMDANEECQHSSITPKHLENGRDMAVPMSTEFGNNSRAGHGKPSSADQSMKQGSLQNAFANSTGNSTKAANQITQQQLKRTVRIPVARGQGNASSPEQTGGHYLQVDSDAQALPNADPAAVSGVVEREAKRPIQSNDDPMIWPNKRQKTTNATTCQRNLSGITSHDRIKLKATPVENNDKEGPRQKVVLNAKHTRRQISRAFSTSKRNEEVARAALARKEDQQHAAAGAAADANADADSSALEATTCAAVAASMRATVAVTEVNVEITETLVGEWDSSARYEQFVKDAARVTCETLLTSYTSTASKLTLELSAQRRKAEGFVELASSEAPHARVEMVKHMPAIVAYNPAIAEYLESRVENVVPSVSGRHADLFSELTPADREKVMRAGQAATGRMRAATASAVAGGIETLAANTKRVSITTHLKAYWASEWDGTVIQQTMKLEALRLREKEASASSTKCLSKLMAAAAELKGATFDNNKIYREREIAERVSSAALEELGRAQKAVEAAEADERQTAVNQEIAQGKAEDAGIACATAETSVCRARVVWETSAVALEKAQQRLGNASGDG